MTTREKKNLLLLFGILAAGGAKSQQQVGLPDDDVMRIHVVEKRPFTEAGRWGNKPPDVVVRSHRHRCIETRIPNAKGYATSFVTAGWQLKTPFAYRIADGRQALPQIGGCRRQRQPGKQGRDHDRSSQRRQQAAGYRVCACHRIPSCSGRDVLFTFSHGRAAGVCSSPRLSRADYPTAASRSGSAVDATSAVLA